MIRVGLRAPGWLGPLPGFLLFALLPLTAAILVAALLGSRLHPQALPALIYLSVAGAGAALAYGLIGAFLLVRSRLRSWVFAFAACTVFFILLAVHSLSDVTTLAGWAVALIAIGGGTVLGGAILRHFAINRRGHRGEV